MSSQSANQNDTKKKASESENFPAQIIVAEITPERNRYLMCAFTQSKLRGRWSITNYPGRSTSTDLANLPTIPGMMVSVNCAARIISFTDPLADEKNKALLERANQAVKSTFGAERKPHEPMVRTECTDDDLKSILCELASWANSGKITVHRGDLPKLVVCRLMKGRRKLNPFDSNPEAPRYEGDPDLRRQTVVQMGS